MVHCADDSCLKRNLLAGAAGLRVFCAHLVRADGGGVGIEETFAAWSKPSLMSARESGTNFVCQP